MKKILINGVPMKSKYAFDFTALLNSPQPEEFTKKLLSHFTLHELVNGIELLDIYQYAVDNNKRDLKNWLKANFNITEEDAYCCQKFEIAVKNKRTIYKNWRFFIAAKYTMDFMSITHCPFCGKKL